MKSMIKKDKSLTYGVFTKGMKRLGHRFDSMEKRLDNRMDSMEKRLDNRMDSMEKRMDNRMDSMEKRMDSMDKRMDSMDKRMDSLATKEVVDKLALKLVKHDEELQYIRENMATKADINQLIDRFDVFASKFTHMERAIFIGEDHRRNISTQLNDHEFRIRNLETKSSPASQ